MPGFFFYIFKYVNLNCFQKTKNIFNCLIDMAIYLLEQNPDFINWSEVSENPKAIHLLRQNPYRINWEGLFSNPSAITLLKQNQDKIDWWKLLHSPSIFEIDYQALLNIELKSSNKN